MALLRSPSHVRLELERLEAREVPALLNTPYLVANGVVSDPSSAVNAAGTRVVVWAQGNAIDSDVWAQRYNAIGDRVGTPIRVTSTTDQEIEPDVAIDGAGNFYVSYTRVNLRANNSQIEVKLFGNAGLLRQSTVIPLSSTFVSQVDSHVACSAAGDAVVSYTEKTIIGDQNVLARMYQINSLNFRRTIFVANSNFVEGESDIARMNVNQPVGATSFAIAYTFNSSDVVVRRYNANGDLINPNTPVLVVANTTLNETNPSIAVNAAGRFAVAWQQQSASFVNSDIFARSFDVNGRLGILRFIATSATDDTDPTIAIRNNGRIVVAYTSQAPGVFNFTINVTQVDDTLLAPIPRTQAVANVGFGTFAGHSTLSVNPADPDVGRFWVAYTVQNTATFGATLVAQLRRFA